MTTRRRRDRTVLRSDGVELDAIEAGGYYQTSGAHGAMQSKWRCARKSLQWSYYLSASRFLAHGVKILKCLSVPRPRGRHPPQVVVLPRSSFS